MIGLGTRQTLASYLSMQTVPDTTESGLQLLSGLTPCALAVRANITSAAPIVSPCRIVLITSYPLCH